MEDQFCPICGYKLEPELKMMRYEWMRIVILITDEEKNIRHGTICGRQYVTEKDTYELVPSRYKSAKKCGIAMHYNCNLVIEDRFDHNLRFRDLVRLVDPDSGVLPSKFYTVAGKGHGKTWKSDAIGKEERYIYANPSGKEPSSVLNRTRILDAWRPITTKINFYDTWDEPSGPAKLYSNGSVRRGGDGKSWEVRGGVWTRYP